MQFISSFPASLSVPVSLPNSSKTRSSSLSLQSLHDGNDGDDDDVGDTNSEIHDYDDGDDGGSDAYALDFTIAEDIL